MKEAITESEPSNERVPNFLNKEMNGLFNSTRILNLQADSNPELLQNILEKSKREKLKSRHGETAEIYDQFYRDHKLLLKLFVILGVMPIVRSAPGLVTFNWKSAQMIYAAIFYLFSTVLVLRVGYERFQILQTTEEFDEYIYAVIFIIFLVPHFSVPYIGWSVATKVAHYKSMWGPFQVRYYRVTGKTICFDNLNRLIIILFVGCVLLSVLFLYLLSRLLDGFLLWHTSAYFHIITIINMNAALLYINTKAIKDASNSLSGSFKKDVKAACTAEMVGHYRRLWLNLNEILQTLGNAYARTFSTYCVFMSVNITVGAYGCLSGLLESGFSYKVLGLIVLTLYCTILLFVVCDCAHKTTAAVAQGVQDTLLNIDLSSLEKQTQNEVVHFISAIEFNPPVVSIEGYGNLNRPMISSIGSTIAIYLIVLLQFKMSIVSEQQFQQSVK